MTIATHEDWELEAARDLQGRLGHQGFADFLIDTVLGYPEGGNVIMGHRVEMMDIGWVITPPDSPRW